MRCEVVPVEVSPPNLDLTPHAYTRQCPPELIAPAAIDFFQHLNDYRPLAELAAEAGISLRCTYKWLARYPSDRQFSLADRRSVRRHQRRTLDSQHLQRAVELRHQQFHLRHIARLLAAPPCPER